MSRKEALIGAAVAAFMFVLGVIPRAGFAAAASPEPTPTPTPRSPGGSRPTPTPTRPDPGGGGGSPTPEPAPTPTKPSFSPPSGSQKVANTASLASNSALTTTDPSTGDPALVIHAANGKFVAYDAICTHAGCTVEYSPANKLIVCPCHGSVYDPENNAQVLQGPAPTPLTGLSVEIDPATGDIYLV